MPKDLSLMPEAEGRAEARAAESLGALPFAPLAMPRQVLENPQGLIARLRPVWDGWLRTYVLGN